MPATLKIVTVLGTRPEIIRLSRVIALLDAHVDHVLVHTGQNADFQLNDVFFHDLRLRAPDHFLNVNRASLGTILGEVLIKTEAVLAAERPDAVLILGDTNSAYAAVIARRMGIPVYHMEAGNRCFDSSVPEEINRRVIDHISDFNLVYTEHARRNLLAEGIHPRRIYLTGSPMREVIDANREAIGSTDVLNQLGLQPRRFFLASIHRAENVDVAANLARMLEALERLASEYGLPVIVSTHPRTRQRLENLRQTTSDALRFMQPFGYHDYMRLQIEAFCTLSDSGTISEESAILGFPAVTMRNAIERPEAMDSGHIVLTGLSGDTISSAVRFVVQQADECRGHAIPEAYVVRNTAARVVKLMLGTAKLGRAWDGLVAA